MRGLLKRLTPSTGIPLIVASIVAGFVLAISLTANAQHLSGRGVDMRNLSGQAASCRIPALKLKQEIILLRQDLSEILECNSQGSFFVDGDCVPHISPAHTFSPDHTGEPDNRDALSFSDPDGTEWALIGGADGPDVECVPEISCEPGSPDWPECFCEIYPTHPSCDDDLPCEEDPDHPDYPDCGNGNECPDNHEDSDCCEDNPNSDICEDDPLPCEEDPECPGFCDENPGHEECQDTETTCSHPCTDGQMSVGASVIVYKPNSWTCESDGYTSTSLQCNESGNLSLPPWGGDYQCEPPEAPENCVGICSYGGQSYSHGHILPLGSGPHAFNRCNPGDGHGASVNIWCCGGDWLCHSPLREECD